MAQENGVELASYLRESDIGCSVIYITAYTLGYFLKPVDEKRLAKAIEWDLRKNYRPEQIALPVNGGLRKVMVQDILYAEVVNHKAAVYLPEEVISVNLSFRELLSHLHLQDSSKGKGIVWEFQQQLALILPRYGLNCFQAVAVSGLVLFRCAAQIIFLVIIHWSKAGIFHPDIQMDAPDMEIDPKPFLNPLRGQSVP